MTTNLERYRKDLETLIEVGGKLAVAQVLELSPGDAQTILDKKKKELERLRKWAGRFSPGYQAWYSEARSLVKQLLPDRLEDFVGHYEAPKNRKTLTAENYRISDALRGLVAKDHWEQEIVGPRHAVPHFAQQLEIVVAIRKRFESSLFEIRQLVQADLFDSELDAARELLQKGFLRAGGAVAGVVLEKHLGQVVHNHNLQPRKSHPTISDLNETLKGGEVTDIPVWRGIQRLGDLRNLCDHGKGRDPTKEEVAELIDGTDKLTKTLY